MGGITYGYVRVSTKNQKEDRQLIALRQYGVEEKRIVVEKQSGKDFERPLYQKLMRRLRAGDTLVVQSLDRLGRDYKEILEQWRVINRERGVSIVVLDMPLLCTKENKELIDRLISDMVLQMLSFVAQTEREKIRERQRQGIEAAKAKGVRFGRPRLEMPENYPEIVARWNRGEFSAREAARMLGVSRSTFFRRVREDTLAQRNRETEVQPDNAARKEEAFLPAERNSFTQGTGQGRSCDLSEKPVDTSSNRIRSSRKGNKAQKHSRQIRRKKRGPNNKS